VNKCTKHCELSCIKIGGLSCVLMGPFLNVYFPFEVFNTRNV
jgi:hypothetical protein